MSIPACSEKDDHFKHNEIETVTHHLNETVEGLWLLTRAVCEEGYVSGFTSGEEDGFSYCGFTLGNGRIARVFNDLNTPLFRVPGVSVAKDGESFRLFLNGCKGVDEKGGTVDAFSFDESPVFSYVDDSWQFSLDGRKYSVIRDDTDEDVYITVDYQVDNNSFLLSFPGFDSICLPCAVDFSIVRKDVPNEVYYKDIFLDAGIGLHSRKVLAAANYLKLSLEGLDLSDEDGNGTQNAIIGGDEMDTNGRLLYPDGQPRYKLVFVAGGNSRKHGRSMSSISLDRMRDYYAAGGSYVGTCAGAFFASTGYDDSDDFPFYLGIVPSGMQHTGLSTCRTGMFVERESPLLDYYSFGGDRYVDGIYHSGGGYLKDPLDGIEVLARYDLPNYKDLHMKPSIWAYKKDRESGRAVLIGSHPEIDASGERRDLMSAMIKYAEDGRGITRLKGILKNGECRVMGEEGESDLPDHSAIGDLQCHHFAFFLPYGAKHIKVTADNRNECRLRLRMNDDSYAFPGSAKYETESTGYKQNLSFVSLHQGLWYVSVQCLTTVDVIETDYGQEYRGRKEVLNGIPYSISVTWE